MAAPDAAVVRRFQGPCAVKPWLWMVLGFCAVACTRPQALVPDAQALLAAERAKALAEKEAAQRELAATEQRTLDRQLGLVAQFEALGKEHGPQVAQLQRWDAAGDGRANPVAETVAAWPKLAALQLPAEACELRLRELADKPLHAKVPPTVAGRVRLWCDLVRRRIPIVQRQVIAAARPFLSAPGWLREVPQRYATSGRVNWHEWLQLRAAERLFAEQAPPHLAAAQAVGAALPQDEMLRPALEARARLEREVDRGVDRLGLPAGVDEAAFARSVTGLWRATAWPEAMLRGNVLAVRAVDPAWLPLRDDKGKVTRQMREGALLLQAGSPAWAAGCWVVWVQVERKAGKDRLIRGDDVRKVKCPGQADARGVRA